MEQSQLDPADTPVNNARQTVCDALRLWENFVIKHDIGHPEIDIIMERLRSSYSHVLGPEFFQKMKDKNVKFEHLEWFVSRANWFLRF